MTPVIGVRNVKVHYNAFKQDLMFTFMIIYMDLKKKLGIFALTKY